MDTNDTIQLVTVMPSTKDQIKSAAIGLGISLAVTVILVGGMTAASAIATRIETRKALKANKVTTAQK